MHSAILCIGSNVSKARQRIENAVDRLTDNGIIVNSRSSIYSVSMPYFNCVAKISTELDICTLVALTKEIESDMGRTQAMKAMSMVPIDIDVVVYDEIMVRPADYSADYFRLGYSSLENL